MTSPNSGIPYVPEGTLDPAAGLNAAIDVVDALLQTRVITLATLTEPPGDPADGDLHIPATGATGAWDGLDDCLVRYVADGAFWQSFEPGTQVRLVIGPTGALAYWNGSAWAAVPGGGATVAVTDGTTTVGAAATIRVRGGGAVADEGGGVAGVTIAAPVVTLSGDTYDLGDLTPGAWHVFTNSGAVTITVEDEADQAVPAAVEYGLEARGAGGVLLVVDDEATIIPPKGGTLELETDDFAVLKHTGTDTWKLVGSTMSAES